MSKRKYSPRNRSRSTSKSLSESSKSKSPKLIERSPKNKSYESKIILSKIEERKKKPIVSSNEEARIFLQLGVEFILEKSIKEVDFSNLGLKTLPEWFGNIATMSDGLPKHEVETLNQMSHIGSIHNMDDIYHKTIGTNTNLMSINLSHNKIKHLPNSFINFTGITSLLLNNNHLVDLPERFGELENLLYLNISYNYIEKLPSSFQNLIHLNVIEAKYNMFEIEKIPPQIEELPNLVIYNF